ncbi:hypothetical protein PR001_g23911 [Phytophthora rubi]|uniref:Uncharacterized protein n=1 Tax=Phytophthora rubi TaxID=129364 RepID=A0A6A3IM52_9STRA|nr:hypothetical protein PR002_g24143 [Phytophthora rubi]KAE8981758.1 hypothetical protein PR001_g23911 [Phytophthora rubi]
MHKRRVMPSPKSEYNRTDVVLFFLLANTANAFLHGQHYLLACFNDPVAPRNRTRSVQGTVPLVITFSVVR